MCESRVRTSWPCLPSGRSAASTSKNVSEANRIISPATRVATASAVFAHEDDVHVADVVQFPRTAFAHRDDGQPRRRGVVLAHGGHRDVQRRGQRRVGHVGQVDADGRERQHRFVLDRGRHVERRPAPAADPGRAGAARPAPSGSGVCADTVGERALELGGRRQCHLLGGRVVQQMPGLRVGDEVIAERQRRTEHARTAARAGTCGQQQRVQFGPVRRRALRTAGPWCAARRRRRAPATATTAIRRARRCSSRAATGRRRRSARPVRADRRRAAWGAASRVWSRQ